MGLNYARPVPYASVYTLQYILVVQYAGSIRSPVRELGKVPEPGGERHGHTPLPRASSPDLVYTYIGKDVSQAT